MRRRLPLGRISVGTHAAGVRSHVQCHRQKSAVNLDVDQICEQEESLVHKRPGGPHHVPVAAPCLRPSTLLGRLALEKKPSASTRRRTKKTQNQEKKGPPLSKPKTLNLGSAVDRGLPWLWHGLLSRRAVGSRSRVLHTGRSSTFHTETHERPLRCRLLAGRVMLA